MESSYQTEESSILINNDNIIQKIITTSSQSKVIYECNITDEINNDCKFLNIQNNTEIINIIKDNINLLYNAENGKGKIIQGENDTIFHITNGKNEKELLECEFLNDQDISIIDLGQCEVKLKEEYNINENDSLIYLKQENTNAKASEKNVQYEIFEPYNFTKLNLSICEEDTINIYVKIDLSEETRNTYEYLKSLGYDMLNINDPFYQDICVPYTYENNTDILLSDRIDYIYNNKDTQCQSNCEFSSYVLNSTYLNCTCTAVQTKEEGDKQKFNGKKLYESFYDILKYSNFRIMKCYKLIFSKNIFKNNIGNFITLSMFSIHFACLIIFIIKGTNPLLNKLKNIFIKDIKKINNKNEIIINDIVIPNTQNQTNNEKILSHPVKRKGSKKKSNSKRKKKKSRTNVISKKDIQEKINLVSDNISVKNNSNISISSKVSLKNSEKKDKIKKIENITPEKDEKKQQDAFELNQLEYDEAIYYDKRTFLKTYLDILYREHKIIFTFFICNDYNLLFIKYARFIFLFATDIAMNVFFFSDESMHKVFLNYGKYNFFQQIPQIIYTIVVSQLIEVFLCYLSLTDKYIYKIKNLKTSINKIETIKILRCMKIKLIMFFIFTSIFFAFYWYVVTAFCAVYENTQIIFLKDSLLSFLFGNLYPFVLYLIPSGLRILSLRSKKAKLKCIYRLSDIIPFF